MPLFPKLQRMLITLIKFKNSLGQVKFTERDDGTIETYDEETFQALKEQGCESIVLVKRHEPK